MSDYSKVFATVAVVAAVGLFTQLFKKEDKPKASLKTGEFLKFPLISKKEVSENTAVYRFKLANEDDVLGLPIGQHITIRATIDDREVIRSYTPISLDTSARGYFDMLIKTYEQGNISKVFDQLKIGDEIEICGPKGFYEYAPNVRKHLAMIAGGSGITPMYQIIKSIAENPKDKTKVDFIYGNVSEEDILLREDLDSFSASRPGQIKIHYLLDKPSEEWKGGVGYVTADVMKEKLPAAAAGVQLLICGPLPMVSSIKRNAVALGFQKAKPVSKMADQIFVF